MRHNYCVEYEGVRIRQLEPTDLEYLRIWRNNPSNSKYLKKIKEITPEMQAKWYEQYLGDNNSIVFAIEETRELKRLVGSVSIYGFEGSLSNCGKTMIGDPDAHGRNLGGRGEILALHVGFQKRGIAEYHTEVSKDNIASVRMTGGFMGFTKVGEAKNENGEIDNLYHLSFDEFYKKHPYLLSALITGQDFVV